MIKRVLIAEDHESANISVQKTLEELDIANIDYVYYCDDALEKIKKTNRTDRSYDLLITDLYFEEDHRMQKVSGGMALIHVVKQEQPDLKIIVFSAESKAAVIEMLIEQYGIDGYVRKARNDAKELKQAITQVSQNQQYFPMHVMQMLKQKNAYEFTEFDITIISLLASGVRQKDIPSYLQQHKIKPSGLSSVEKRLNQMKEILEFSQNEQLIAFCKDMGII
ncbi:MAG TPA: response regulator [Chitinophagaceae bacterium]|nr:response regulator [Chitinophagaceae bacterium]